MSAIERIERERPIESLWEQTGKMASLGSEDGTPRLDWVRSVPRLLAHDSWLDAVEQEAAGIVGRGIRRLIWSGMGGSIMAVRVLVDLGVLTGGALQFAVHPLDSTDPAAMNALVQQLMRAHGLESAPSDPAGLRHMLSDVMMVAVSMGMTSEEPITHVQWFTDLLDRAGLRAADHVFVMTLPGSYLDAFAHEHGVPSRPLQPDGGTGTGGRMSAPGTRVFLLPAALALHAVSTRPGELRAVLDRAWRLYDFEQARARPGEHPFVRLAAALSDASLDGACGMPVEMPDDWRAFVPWIEQLLEESLGKDGKGIVTFDGRSGHGNACGMPGTVVRLTPGDADSRPREGMPAFALSLPYLGADTVQERLAAAGALFLGWQLTMALYGYLEEIVFAGQPAVEGYKARARALRSAQDPLQVVLDAGCAVRHGPLTLLGPPDVDMRGSPAASLASVLLQVLSGTRGVAYLDLTFNGEPPRDLEALLAAHLGHMCGQILGVPGKLRRAPAAYHSTEQSEMDGPVNMVSVRVVAREHEPALLGSYSDTFLKAQAAGTWQAMVEKGRRCFLLVLEGQIRQMIEPLDAFFREVERHLSAGKEVRS